MSRVIYMLQDTTASTGHFDHILDHPKHLLYLITVAQFVITRVPEIFLLDVVHN